MWSLETLLHKTDWERDEEMKALDDETKSDGSLNLEAHFSSQKHTWKTTLNSFRNLLKNLLNNPKNVSSKSPLNGDL